VAALSDQPVRAAGGVVWRDGDDVTEVVVVHRPAYDDWSLPKGKAAPGESDEECALREVREETGLLCELGPELPGTRYRDRHGRDKVVRYWAMRPGGGRLEPDEEVDEARWVPIDEARRLVSYERDRGVLDALQPALAGAGEG
jgi:8-oxo-dGTP pyrophosphatase MutT (NUDIX family)